MEEKYFVYSAFWYVKLNVITIRVLFVHVYLRILLNLREDHDHIVAAVWESYIWHVAFNTKNSLAESLSVM